MFNYNKNLLPTNYRRLEFKKFEVLELEHKAKNIFLNNETLIYKIFDGIYHFIKINLINFSITTLLAIYYFN